MSTSTLAAPLYSVRGVKSFEGMEGLGFNASLYRDGRKVAFVIDEGCGGCLLFNWLDKDAAVARADSAALDAHVKTLPEWSSSYAPGETYPMDADLFLADLVAEVEVVAELKRKLKRHAVFLLDGAVKQLPAKHKPSPQLFAQIVKKWPAARLLNSMSIDEALAVWRSVPEL